MTAERPTLEPRSRRTLLRQAAACIVLTLLDRATPALGQAAPTPPPPPPPGPPRQEIPDVADPSITPPAYDVVSIKPNKSASGGSYYPRRILANNIPIKFVIASAYDIKDDLITGGPGWVDSARYDITAKVAPADVDTFKKLTMAQRTGMLQPLLADRFKLQAHVETKTLPIYELVLAKGGSKLHEAVPGDTYANAPKFNGNSPRAADMMMMMPGKITGMAIPIANPINILSRQLQRTIVDKTGPHRKYDITPPTDPRTAKAWASPGGAGALPPPPPPRLRRAVRLHRHRRTTRPQARPQQSLRRSPRHRPHRPTHRRLSRRRVPADPLRSPTINPSTFHHQRHNHDAHHDESLLAQTCISRTHRPGCASDPYPNNCFYAKLEFEIASIRQRAPGFPYNPGNVDLDLSDLFARYQEVWSPPMAGQLINYLIFAYKIADYIRRSGYRPNCPSGRRPRSSSSKRAEARTQPKTRCA